MIGDFIWYRNKVGILEGECKYKVGEVKDRNTFDGNGNRLYTIKILGEDKIVKLNVEQIEKITKKYLINQD